jgi:hypothetical protein
MAFNNIHAQKVAMNEVPGPHGSEYENDYLLGYDATQSDINYHQGKILLP